MPTIAIRHHFTDKLRSMLPLLLVYIAEYTINQGVSPTLLFPLASSPFHHYRAFYPTYNAIYRKCFKELLHSRLRYSSF